MDQFFSVPDSVELYSDPVQAATRTQQQAAEHDCCCCGDQQHQCGPAFETVVM